MEIVFVCGKQAREEADPVRRAILRNTLDCLPHITATATISAETFFRKPTVILLKNNAVLPEPFRLPPTAAVAFDGENSRVSAFLKKIGGSGVDFGTSPRSTVSLSSMTDTSATVSVQRNLVLVDGRILEPCEIPVTLSVPMSPRQVLASVAVLLLAGVPWESGYCF